MAQLNLLLLCVVLIFALSLHTTHGVKETSLSKGNLRSNLVDNVINRLLRRKYDDDDDDDDGDDDDDDDDDDDGDDDDDDGDDDDDDDGDDDDDDDDDGKGVPTGKKGSDKFW
mmetsp:Transcript_31905/g.47079  ORF Transcript_31905/g.47079 Transcript_31905/m.47079 type:complete len:113 (-) Transcript_31905:253-591(-)